jgi:hypothetical protein
LGTKWGRIPSGPPITPSSSPAPHRARRRNPREIRTIVEVDLRIVIATTRVDHGPPETLRESGFPIRALVVTGQLGDEEAGTMNLDAESIIDPVSAA